MTTDNLKQLMVEGLKDLYDAEKQISEALPKMAREAKAPALREAFEEHLTQTRSQIRRLEKVFQELNVSDRKKECKGMQAIIHEGEEMMKQASDASVRDAALISAAQHVEHYEMAGYGTVVAYAQQLDHNDVADELQKSLNEEKLTDLKLSQLAEMKVNTKAI
jgi:ferritin-like metal-binding protein YciE